MHPRFDFDGTLKELFQQDRPTLLGQLTHGVAIKEFLNVELPKVQQRRVDLLIALADDTLLHVEFQSVHDRHIPYRMLEYRALIQRRFPGPLRQVVLFVGQRATRILDRIEEDGLTFRYEVMDLREIQAEDLIRTGNQGDLALGLLAGGGSARLPEILRRARRLRGTQRERLLAQILVLSGLRKMAKNVEWRLKHMPVIIDIDDIPVIRHVYREAEAKGRAEGEAKGEAKGRAKGKVEMLQEQIQAKFGVLPKWASTRLSRAKPVQLDRWAKKILFADTLEHVIGSRHRNGS